MTARAEACSAHYKKWCFEKDAEEGWMTLEMRGQTMRALAQFK
jgi:hypothetical protein